MILQTPKALLSTFLVLLVKSAQVTAETHTVEFDNRCGRGTPTLKAENGAVLSTGGSFTINGPLLGATAFLQTGACGINGEGCAIAHIDLQNPTSSVVVDCIAPSVISFKYFNGCNGIGSNGSPCSTTPVTCQANNVGLAITFC